MGLDPDFNGRFDVLEYRGHRENLLMLRGIFIVDEFEIEASNEFYEETWHDGSGELVAKALSFANAEGNEGHGVTDFAAGGLEKRICRVESLRQELGRFLPLIGISMDALKSEEDYSIFQEMIVSQLTISLDRVLICKWCWRIESQTLIDNLV